MGWFWGASDNDGNKPQDPLRNLDPSLRDYLAKESPVKYNSTNPPSPPTQAALEEPTKPLAKTAELKTEDDTAPKVPPQSLFPDGRYAHLWKTYVPLSETEQESKTDQEKINDILEGYKYRKAEIGKAALENCALEQWQVNECFKSGPWASKMTMCRTENRRLDRCFLMQSKFLKALGYLSTFDRPPELDEKIQMHADTLYQRMMEQEKAIETAKAEGLPIPTFPPLLSPKSRALPNEKKPYVDENKLQPSQLSPNVQAALKKRLEGLNDNEREVEESAIKAELRAGEQVAEQLGSIYTRQAEDKKKRKEEGKETIGDKLTTLFRIR